MSFIQVIEFDTADEQEVQRLMDEWRDSTGGGRTVTHTTLTRDRARPGHYVAIVRFPSYEEAMRNSELPQTGKLADRMRELCDGPPRYMDLDVIRDEDL
ncbi:MULTISPECIES: hypothetical protein [Streptosporangium]|uniref:ABM domain-containing protein n=1 Tax=Streptosporangium brasiliense TaxID=47480 RepID=A0ABT9R556_9ACTN|nr:hypothetical protein [Streptosporangium brasiliense]MDP9864362.1 hypothetical protein [Streptosporangium brasiliense]